MKKIKYIEDDEKFGIEYDYKFLVKEYKKLVPEDYHFVAKLPWGRVGTMALLSERSLGKTTNLLIFGMLMNKYYGTEIQYVRIKEESIMNKALNDLFTTIIDCGYIEKITDGEYNIVIYKARRWYYAKVNEIGEVEKIAEHHFMFCCSVLKAENLKSSYNAPKGDLILFDEFISRTYYDGVFSEFLDLTKTIIRGRFSPTICMLANTIDKNSDWFDELECRDIVDTMETGDAEIYETSLGGLNYITYLTSLALSKNEIKDSHNKKYYGYSNGDLNAITGYGWSCKEYPHIFKHNDVIHYCYIRHHNRLVRLELQLDPQLGTYVNVVPAKTVFPREVVFTVEPIFYSTEHYRFGHSKLDEIVWSKFRENKFYYATNGIGAFVHNYVKVANSL